MRMNSTFFVGFFMVVSGIPTAFHSPGPRAFHGIHVEVSARSGIHVARAYYEGGGPVVNGDVTIMPPGSEEAWQTGRTDPSGRFAFFPDAPGTWIVQVDDGGGHRTRATFEVGAGGVTAGPEGESGLWRLLTGLGLMAGITGVAYGYTARRKLAGAV